MTTDSKVRSFAAVAEALAFHPTEYDQFNADIQLEIEHSPPDVALALAQIKLEANRRFYWAVKRGA